MPAKPSSALSQVSGQLTFFRLHILAGLFVPLVAAAILYGSNGENHIHFIDALFLCVSALTSTGLTSTYVSFSTRWQQVILYALMTFGSIPAVAIITLLFRRQRFKAYLKHAPKNFEKINDQTSDHESHGSGESETRQEDQEQQQSQRPARSTTTTSRNYDRGGFPNPVTALFHSASSQLRKRLHPSSPNSNHHSSSSHDEKRRYLSFDHKAKAQRNSHFTGLSQDEKYEVGQLEYKAMTLLAAVMVTYAILCQLLAVVIWAPYFSAGHYTDPDFDNGFETSRTWFAFFEASSMFNNVGLSLVDSSLAGFQSCYILLVPAIFLMYSGYFGFPVAIRGVLWILSRVLPKKSSLTAPLFFLRDHPRRVSYLLFPSYETWVFAIVVFIFTMIDWVLFAVLNIGNGNVYGSLSGGQIAVGGLVQAVATRSSGFYYVTFSSTAPALHISYLFMMLFAVYPIAMAIRVTNVYEERSLGIDDDDEHSEKGGLTHVQKEGGYVKVHIQQQLAYDAWWLIMCTFIICIADRGKITDSSRYGWFSVFAIIFEVTSAYANVGFSLGVPYSDASFATSLSTVSKLVLMAAMIRGRTRELPIAIDRAVLTPHQLQEHGDPVEHEDGDRGETAANEAEESGQHAAS